MNDWMIVKVNLYNGVFDVDRLPRGVEVQLVDQDGSAHDESRFPGGTRKVRYFLNRRGQLVEEQVSRF